MPAARILIVEDEVLIANNLQAVLEDVGHEAVGVAADLEGALRLAEQRPDIALVDIHLRDGPTGADVAERLASEHGVAVIFLTANPRMLKPTSAGLGVLEKPCDDELLQAAIDYALQAREGAPLPSPPPGMKLLH